MRTVLALALLVWEPLNFASRALMVLPTLGYRGFIPGLELAVHAIVAALNAGAGLALLNETPSARRLATLAVLASCALTIHSVSYSTLPNETVPGQEPYVIVAALSLSVVALAIIRRSARSSR